VLRCQLVWACREVMRLERMKVRQLRRGKGLVHANAPIYTPPLASPLPAVMAVPSLAYYLGKLCGYASH
jgi:hypothetical protein